MKNVVPFFVIVANAFTFSCFAQHSNNFLVNIKVESMQLLSDRMAKNEMVIVAYQVEEKINLRFGGTTTTYTVPSLNLINTNDLGEDNKRTITPKYARAKIVGLDELPKAPLLIKRLFLNLLKLI